MQLMVLPNIETCPALAHTLNSDLSHQYLRHYTLGFGIFPNFPLLK